MYAVAFLLAPSAKTVFFAAAVLVWHFWPRTKGAYVGLLGALVLAGWLLYLLDARELVSRISSAETGSFYARITVAPLIGVEALRNFPILGYGIGNHQGMYDLMRDVWQLSGGFASFPYFRPVTSQGLMTNGFWWQWAYLGVLGGLILTFLVVRLLSLLGVEHPIRTVTCTWIVWYAGFGFVDPASWWILAVFAIPEVARRVATENTLDFTMNPTSTAAGLDAVCHGQGGKHDGQVGSDGVAGAVKHGQAARSVLDMRNNFSTSGSQSDGPGCAGITPRRRAPGQP